MKYNKALNHWLQTPSSQPKVAAGFIVKVATCRHYAYICPFSNSRNGHVTMIFLPLSCWQGSLLHVKFNICVVMLLKSWSCVEFKK